MKRIALSAMLLISGCAPFVPVANLKNIPDSEKLAASSISIFTIDGNRSYPKIEKQLGSITAYSCKHWLTDPPASKGDALVRLRIEALKLGANGIIDVTFDSHGTDTYGTNCWQTIQASGTAIRFIE
jgi:uncharacterized protein YbjQ (UPF0145 family)